jgi:uncharacterized membrane protein
MAICNACGADVAEGVKFCPQCGQTMTAAQGPSYSEASAGSGYGQQASFSAGANMGGGGSASAPPPSAPTGSNDNVMGAVAYITIIPAILFLLLEPYNKNRFIRFHAFQCIFFALGAFALSIGNMILSIILGFVPVVGWVISLILAFGVPIAILVAWLIMVVKAYQGQEFRMPVIGNFAAKQA